MNIHEHQAKELLAQHGVATLQGSAAYSADEAGQIAKDLGGKIWVVKSQIHAGGRGAGHFQGDENGKGGVRIAQSIDEVRAHAQAMMNNVLVTKQTGPQGKQVKRLFVEQGCDIDRELYLSLVLDRASSSITIIASGDGGMDIETLAEEQPEKVAKIHINPANGIGAFQYRALISAMGLSGETAKTAKRFVQAIYQAYCQLDASMIEINPLVITKAGEVIALDAKMGFDDNALYRHSDIAAMRDPSEEDERENKAAEYELNYIALDGDIGCMVNGAGLAMATMDIIKLKGAAPANFLDVGGGATAERVTQAFTLILSDPNVKGILVNIFGGIMRCDVIAQGIIEAARTVTIDCPLVVRLAGTNVDQGKEILKNSDLPIITASSLNDAAEKIVKAVRG